MAKNNAQCTMHNAQRKYIDAEIFAKRIKASPAFEKMAFAGELLQRVVLDLLGNTPTADVEEVKHGEWISNEFGRIFICSECSEMRGQKEKYCPNCGAKMDGRRDT